MKFKNNTKWNTQQLRKIIAAVMNRYLSQEQRRNLTVVADSVRAGGNFKSFCDGGSGWREGVVMRPGYRCVVWFTIPNDITTVHMRFHCTGYARQWAATRKKETRAQYGAWTDRVDQMPLDEAVIEKKKKDPLEKSKKNLKSSLASSDEWKDKMLRASNKVQEYDKKAKYYTARIILLKKQRSGEVRKKKSPKAGDRDFRIARRRRGT
jgi:hypothetical protein